MKNFFASKAFIRSPMSGDEQRLKSVLFDWTTYEEWNPYILAIQGEAKPDAWLQVRFHLGMGLITDLSCQLLFCDRDEGFFAWRYRARVPYAYDAVHSFRLIKEGHSFVLIQSEEMQGALACRWNWGYRMLLAARFEAMHQALESRAHTLSTEQRAS